MTLSSSMRCETRNERWDRPCSALRVARLGPSGISQDRQCKGAADEWFLRVFVILARLNSALGLAHPHYILLIHSMLWEIGANMELAMPSRRKSCADRIKHPDAGTEGAPGTSGCVPVCLAMGGRAQSGADGLCAISHRDQWKLPTGAILRGNVQAGSRQHSSAPAGRLPRRAIGDTRRKLRSADQNRIQQRDPQRGFLLWRLSDAAAECAALSIKRPASETLHTSRPQGKLELCPLCRRNRTSSALTKER
jgi:hypothetical protein